MKYMLMLCSDVGYTEDFSAGEALELAAAHPWAKYGQIEVRPVWEP